MSEKKFVIVVPVYKKRLGLFESVSLKQLFKILGNYPICFVAPSGFELGYDEVRGKKYDIMYFSKEYFESVEGYSRLMLEKEFYNCFLNYEYILIHQLDCFIFKDSMGTFCDLGYDYIGAPIHQNEGFWNEYHIGNGGLSLRNVKKCLKLLDQKADIINNHPYPDLVQKAEDVFFSYCGGEPQYDFSIPPIEVAETFSLYVDSEEKKRSICDNGLPFGIHYFPKYYYEFWRPFVQIYGYSLPETPSGEKDRRYLMLMNQWMINVQKGNTIGTFLKNKGYHRIAVYGMSVYARHLIRELEGSEVSVSYGIDRWNNNDYGLIKVYKPDEINENVDAVINTVIWDHSSVENVLKQRLECPVISLEDLVFEEYWNGN